MTGEWSVVTWCCRQRRCFQCQLEFEQGKRYQRVLLLGFVLSWRKKKSWGHTEFGSNLQKERDQTHRLIVCFFQYFSSYYQDLFFTFWRQGLWIHASKLPGELFSCLECGIHTAPCEGRSSLVVWTGYFCPCPLFLVGNVCVLEDFQCLFCRGAAASSLVLGDAYSII